MTTSNLFKTPAKINGIPYAKLAKMSPKEQVEKCGLEIPPFLRITSQAQVDARKAAWANIPLTSMRSFGIGGREKPSWRSEEDHAEFLRRQDEQAAQRNAPRQPKEKAVTKEPKAKRASKEGLITVQAIAKELNMQPRDARGILRAAKIKKPDVGWAGDAKWAADIKATLQNAPAKEKKARGERSTKGNISIPRQPKVKADGTLKKPRKFQVAKRISKSAAKDTVWSGDAKITRKDTVTPAAEDVVKKNEGKNVKWEITARKGPNGWIMRANDVLIQTKEGGTMRLPSAKACTEYAKEHYGVGCEFLLGVHKPKETKPAAKKAAAKKTSKRK